MLRSFASVMAILILAIHCKVSFADVAVVYPQVAAPYNQIFEDIISGIEQQHDGEVLLKPLKKNANPESAVNWLKQQGNKKLIALGKRGYGVAKRVNAQQSVVIGALPIRPSPSGMSGISLLADPRIMFQSLKQLAPKITKVNVVYSNKNQWLIDLAKAYAGEFGLTMHAVLVPDIKTALSTYDLIMADLNNETDAIWLPLDNITANEQVILPELLKHSWRDSFVLFSSKPAHAKRGALFSMFPDHLALGKQLVTQLQQLHNDPNTAQVIPLSSMKLAVNLRTAAHLGFEYKANQKNRFHLTFP